MAGLLLHIFTFIVNNGHFYLVTYSYVLEMLDCPPCSAGGWDTCIQATEGASMFLSMENSSTGTPGEPLHLWSSPSDVYGTCSGTRKGAILPLLLHLPIPILFQIPRLILTPVPILLRTPNPKFNPNLKTTSPEPLTPAETDKIQFESSSVSSPGLLFHFEWLENWN